MAAMVWIGAAMAVAGLGGLVWCIVVAARARSAKLQGAAMQERLRRLVAVNLGALALSALGLMLVVMGVILG